MTLTLRVKEILSWYSSENPGTIRNLARMLNFGTLAGTGKFVILPVDQGFEHGPARSFAPNSMGYDPLYHAELALDAGCNAYAAPLGFIESVAREYPELPLILKLNNADSLYTSPDPVPAVTASTDDALRLGCCAIGYTIYPGSAFRNEMYEKLQYLTQSAKEVGLAVVVWSYPRGSGITSREGETAIDVVAYAAQIAAQLGANIIKVKPPSSFIYQEAARKIYDEQNIPIGTLTDRVTHVLQAAFNGRRIVIFSGGAAKGREEILQEIREIHKGGGFGSIIGRNSFQRPKEEAISLLNEIMEIYRTA
ncbi:MAG: class I fructose-bisphosphate aldolase [Candidatus Heimdallarchaeota archaeon]